jgi:hypothetical protein
MNAYIGEELVMDAQTFLEDPLVLKLANKIFETNPNQGAEGLLPNNSLKLLSIK